MCYSTLTKHIKVIISGKKIPRDTVVEQGGIEVCLEILREKNDVLYEHMLLALQYLAKEEAFAIRMA